jgi:hypothetical protein
VFAVYYRVIKPEHKCMIALPLLDYSRKRNIQKQLTKFLSVRESTCLPIDNLQPSYRFNNIEQKPYVFHGAKSLINYHLVNYGPDFPD